MVKCARCPGPTNDSDVNLRTGKPHTCCKTCRDKRSFKLNPDRREKMKSYYLKIDQYKQRRQKTKNQFFDMYGTECACCGEKQLKFLTLDHILCDGYQERKILGGSDAIYRKAIQKYRPDLYRVLCYNCNCGKSNNTNCPHSSAEIIAMQGEGK